MRNTPKLVGWEGWGWVGAWAIRVVAVLLTTKTSELFFSKLKFAGSGLFSQIRSHMIVKYFSLLLFTSSLAVFIRHTFHVVLYSVFHMLESKSAVYMYLVILGQTPLFDTSKASPTRVWK